MTIILWVLFGLLCAFEVFSIASMAYYCGKATAFREASEIADKIWAERGRQV